MQRGIGTQELAMIVGYYTFCYKVVVYLYEVLDITVSLNAAR